MKNEMRITKVLVYRSEIRPSVETTSEELAKVIEWADELVTPYKIVTSTKSKAFGKASSAYFGWARAVDSSEAILERLRVLKDHSEGKIFFWKGSALFTLKHFDDAGFTGGFFRAHCLWTHGEESKEYPRSSCILDYTKKTLEKVLDRFAGWVEPYSGPMTRITVDDINRRVFEQALPEGQ